jgi:hypothetical protein
MHNNAYEQCIVSCICAQENGARIFMVLRNISWYLSVVWLLLLLLSSAMTVLPEAEDSRTFMMAVEGLCSIIFLGLGAYFMWLFRRHPTSGIFHAKWIQYGYIAFAILLTGVLVLGGVV